MPDLTTSRSPERRSPKRTSSGSPPLSSSYCFRLKRASETTEANQHILFVDQGSCFTDMYIVRVNQTDCEVVRSESKQFGAKDLDRILFDHFVAEIARKRGMTIRPAPSRQFVSATAADA